MCLLRLAEILFALYFFVHLSIGIMIDSRLLSSSLGIPDEWYPDLVTNLSKQYVVQFKDPYMVNPPAWIKIFLMSELFLQVPFSLVAGFAFLLGGRAWIRTPTIIYCVHVITSVIPVIYSVAVDDFSKMNRVGPVTQEERLSLISVYAPWLIIPLLMLFTMVANGNYGCAKQQPQQKAGEKAKKKQYSKKHQ